MSKATPKNLFATKTMQGVYIMLAGFLLSSAPVIGNIASRHTENEKSKADIGDIVKLVALLGGAFQVARGRMSAESPVYTPDFLPGANKSDFDGTGEP